MNKIFLCTFFAAAFSVGSVFSFVLETDFVKQDKNIQWILNKLNEFRCPDFSEFCLGLESVPFYPFENNPEQWVMGLTIKTYDSDPLIDLTIRSLTSKKIGHFSINGTARIRNSTDDNTFYEMKFEKERVCKSEDDCTIDVLSVSFHGIFPRYRLDIGTPLTFQKVFEMLDNVLILELTLTIMAPLTYFRN